MAPTFWQEWEIGQRVTVRYRIEGGFSDALGYIRRIDSTGMDIETKRGLVTVPAELITIGKRVPPPPPRRRRRL
ncbi:MAG TPA: ferrous iron transport protein A [Beutenbergiaceae bacterium]|nr:ferrous iron transport protein A [Beutenbergiaceae bacterium]